MTHRAAHDLPVRWFLDIDGVVSPYGLTEPWNGPSLYGGPPDSDLAVPYRREVVQRIQRLHDSGLVDIAWLTTWDLEAADGWTDVGLGPFPVHPRRRPGHNRWWKVDAVQTWMRKHSTSRAIWTDDDISRGGLRGLDKNRLLAIAPDPRVGLTDNDLQRIETWVLTDPESQGRP
ncbi:HAD domain-containing protein [Nocardioides taihuensis]|uniref:HAD domain-containing protein n=1 Tax=Nocardioides taihuensis TaxID=1835606 RepID=A0ABW0BF88_9ACTN